MKSLRLYTLAISILLLGVCGCEDSVANEVITANPHIGADQNTIALYIVMDGSGSMADSVADGNSTNPKWVIANNAVIKLGNILDAYLKSNPSKKILTGIVLFKNARITVSDFGVVTNNVTGIYQKWVNGYSDPNGGTPIGTAITAAASCFANDNVKSKHIMVLTDGENNIGYGPYTAVTKLNNSASVHFIAFDVNSAVFNDVKKLGCIVANASNATELQKRVNTIVKNEILLEKED